MAAQLAQLAAEQRDVDAQVVAWQAERERREAGVEAHGRALADAQTALGGQERAVELLERDERGITEQLLALETQHAAAAVALQRQSSERDRALGARGRRHYRCRAAGRAAGAADTARLREEAGTGRSGSSSCAAASAAWVPVNALAPEEYTAAQQRHTFLTEQLADVRAASASLRDAIGTLDQVMQEHFETTFAAVGQEFSRTFTQLFGGGSAKLMLQEEERVGQGAPGIEIVAQPPGKRQLNLQLPVGRRARA